MQPRQRMMINTLYSKKVPQEAIHPPQKHLRSSHRSLKKHVLHGC